MEISRCSLSVLFSSVGEVPSSQSHLLANRTAEMAPGRHLLPLRWSITYGERFFEDSDTEDLGSVGLVT